MPNSLKPRLSVDGICVLALVGVVALFIAIQYWVRPGLADWDILGFYLPWYAHMGESLRAFDIPGWNPYILSGVPFAGDPQSGWWYFPAMLLFTVFPPVFAFKLLILVQCALAAVCLYIFVRLNGIRPIAAVTGGLIYGLCQTAGISSCCTIHLQLMPWIPLSLVGVEMALRQKRWNRSLLWLGLAAFGLSQMASAWVGQGMYNGFLLVAGYLGFRCLWPPTDSQWRVQQRIVRGALFSLWAFGLGLAMAAAGVLPRLDAVQRSYVGSDEYQHTGGLWETTWRWGQSFAVLTQFRWEWFPYYIGGAAATLAVVGMIGQRDRLPIRFFAVSSLVIVSLTLRTTWVHSIFYLLPEFERIHLHDPARVLVVLPMGVSVLAAAGFDVLHVARVGRREILLAGAGTVTVLFLTAVNPDRTWSWLTTFTVGSAAVVVMVILAAIVSRVGNTPNLGKLVVAAGLLLMFIYDPVGKVLLRSQSAEERNQTEQAVIVNSSSQDPGGAGEFFQLLQASGQVFRYYGFVGPSGPSFQAHEYFTSEQVMPLLINNRAMRLNLYDVQGYNPAQLVSYLQAFAELNGFERDYHEALVYREGIDSDILRMLNVRFMIVDNTDALLPDGGGRPALPARYVEVFSNRSITVYEDTAALPRAWMIHDVIAGSPETALGSIEAGQIDPAQTAIVDASVAVPPLTAPSSPDVVQIETYKSDQVAIHAESDAAGLLVLADTFDPGWTVEIDGVAAKVIEVNGLIRGVWLGPGAHDVTFRYAPRSLALGMQVSVIAFGVVLLLIVQTAWTERRRPRSQVAGLAA